MTVKKAETSKNESATMLMTARAMAKRSGIGENTLRRLMEEKKIEYLQVGSHRLLCDQAVWDYYQRYKTPAIAG